MPDFAYTARDSSGKQVTGTLSAAGEREALATLSGKSLFPLSVQATTAVAEPKRLRRVPAQLLSTTYGQLADLLRSGVPLLRAIRVLQEQSSHSGLRAVLDEVYRQVEDGATLPQALGRFPRVFGDMAISMIRAGSEGGFLEEALSRVAEFTEAQEDLKKRTLGAVIYPLVLCVIGTAVVTVLIVFFVPMFAELFDRLRQRNELPWATDALLAISGFLRTWGAVALAAGIAAVWFSRRWLASDAGRTWWDRVRLKVPVAGGIAESLAVSRFTRVLGTLLRNGVPLIRSLDIASDATGNRVLAEAIRAASEDVSAGRALAEPLARSGRFPPMVIEMIAVAEQANNLERVLIDIADGLERRTWRRLDLAVRLLEPILLLILAGVVLFVVIALILPVLKMSGTI